MKTGRVRVVDNCIDKSVMNTMMRAPSGLRGAKYENTLEKDLGIVVLRWGRSLVVMLA